MAKGFMYIAKVVETDDGKYYPSITDVPEGKDMVTMSRYFKDTNIESYRLFTSRSRAEECVRNLRNYYASKNLLAFYR